MDERMDGWTYKSLGDGCEHILGGDKNIINHATNSAINGIK